MESTELSHLIQQGIGNISCIGRINTKLIFRQVMHINKILGAAGASPVHDRPYRTWRLWQ